MRFQKRGNRRSDHLLALEISLSAVVLQQRGDVLVLTELLHVLLADACDVYAGIAILHKAEGLAVLEGIPILFLFVLLL